MLKFFKIKENNTTVRAEIIAGITTFMAMVYILIVNAGIFTSTLETAPGSGEFFQIIPGISFQGMYIATAIGAIVGTMLMAFLAKMPLAQASGMGINAFVVFTLVLSTGMTYANCMVFTLLEGVIFLLLTVTGLRTKIFHAIPAAVRHAIPVGIGMFIAFIGMQNAGIIVNDDSTLVTFVSFNLLNGNAYAMLPPAIALVGVIAIAVLSKKNVKGAVLWGILGSAALYYAISGIAAAMGNEAAIKLFQGISLSNPFEAFGAWWRESAGKVFTEGFDFSAYLNATDPKTGELVDNNTGSLVMVLITTALSLCMLDMFDTIGTLYGACARGNLLDETGKPLNMEKSMLADAIATCAGAMAGTSTVTTFVESSSGVAAGGKTGLTAFVTGVCFILAMFLSPIAQLIPNCATATALIWVGVLMMASVTKIDWNDPAEAITGFMTFIIMALGYGISTGIGLGILTFVLVKLATGKVKEISVATWVLSAFFLATFLLT